MKTLKTFMAENSVIKTVKVGKSKTKATIAKEGSKYSVTVDGKKIDEFKSAKEAEAAIKDLAKLMDS